MKIPNIVILFMAGVLFASCSKKYRYIEIVEEYSLWGGYTRSEKEEKIISAKSDSLAYLDAFREFCISQKVYNDMSKKGMGEYLDIPVSFELYDAKDREISSTISFCTKEKRESEIADMIFTIDNVVERASKTAANKQDRVIDSSLVAKLIPYFDQITDEFDPRNPIWFKPKSAPKYINANGIYLYFNVIDGKPGPLILCIQYYAEDWLFLKKIQFSIDDQAYEFIPSDIERDNSAGMIWEWFDEKITRKDKDLITSLSIAKSAKMKFIGQNYYDIKTISSKQIADIKRTIDLYVAMGGNF